MSEYIPEVGDKCQAVWLELPDGGSRSYENIEFKGDDGVACWFKSPQGYEVSFLEHIVFRPIKTQAETVGEKWLALHDADVIDKAASHVGNGMFCVELKVYAQQLRDNANKSEGE